MKNESLTFRRRESKYRLYDFRYESKAVAGDFSE
jgi:hypothetical protein